MIYSRQRPPDVQGGFHNHGRRFVVSLLLLGLFVTGALAQVRETTEDARNHEKNGFFNAAVEIYLHHADKYSGDREYNIHLGELLIKTERPKLAITYYEIAFKLKPNDVKVMKVLADLYLEDEALYKSVKMYRMAVENTPGAVKLQATYMKLAEKTGDDQEMKKAYDLVQRKNPKSHQAFFKQAKLHHQMKKHNIAYDNLMKALKLAPANKEYQELLPRVIKDDSQIKESFAILKKLAQKKGASIRTKLLCAKGYSQKKQYKQAAPLFKAVYQEEPGMLEDNLDAIKALSLGGQHKMSEFLANRFLKRHPNSPEAAALHVKSLEKSGAGKGEMQEAIERLVQLDPNASEWWLKLARLNLASGHKASAIKYSRKWVDKNPKSLEGLNFLLPLVKENKQYRDVYISTLERLIKLEPKKSPPRKLELGLIRYRQKKFDQAEKLLSSAAKSYPKNAELFHKLGKIRLQKKLKGSGRSEIKKAWQLEPGNIDYARDYSIALKSDTDIKNNLKLFQLVNKHSPNLDEKLKLAKAYYLNKRYDEAARLFRGLVKDDARLAGKPMVTRTFIKTGKLDLVIPSASHFAGDFQLNFDLAVALEKAGKKKDALRFFSVASKLKPGDFKLLLRTARLNAAQGNKNKAMEKYREVLNKQPKNKEYQKEYFKVAGKTKNTGTVKAAYEYVLRGDPQAHGVLFQLTKINLKQKDKGKAYQNISKAIKIKPLPEYLALLPKTIVSDAQILAKLKILQSLAAKPGADARTLMLTAQGYSLKKNKQKAAGLYEQVYNKDKKILQGNTDAIKVLYSRKKYTIAADLSEKYLHYKPKDLAIREIQVKAYEKMGAGEDKLKNGIKALVKLDPETKDWWLTLAKLELASGYKKEALKHGKKWIKRNPKSLEGYEFLLPLVQNNKREQATYIMVLENLNSLVKKPSLDRNIKLGLLYYNIKKYYKSEQLLAAAVKTKKNDPEIWYILGMLRSKNSQGGGGKEFARAYQLKPDKVEYARAYGKSLNSNNAIKKNLGLFKLLNQSSPTFSEQVKLAKSHYLNGNTNAASDKFIEILGVAPELADTEPMIMSALNKGKKYKAIINIYETRLGYRSNDLGILDTLSMLYEKTGDKNKYQKTADRILRIDPTYGEFQLRRARALVKNKKGKKAMGDYDEFVSRNMTHKKALTELYKLAKTYKDTTRMMKAAGYLVKLKNTPKKYAYVLAELKLLKNSEPKSLAALVAKDVNYKLGRKLLIMYYYKKGNIARLAKYQKYLVANSLKDKSLLPAHADLMAHKKANKKAGELYYKAVLANPKDKKLLDKALKFTQSRKLPQAKGLLAHGRKNFPDDGYIKFEYAKSLGKTEGALNEYLGVLKDHPDRLDAIKAVVTISERLNRPEPSIKWLKKWNKLEPHNKKPLVRLAEIYTNKKDIDNLIDVLVDLKKLKPKDHKLAFRIGKLFNKKKKLKKAADYYGLAANVNPKNTTYQRHLGMTLADMGKFRQARKPLKAAYNKKKFDEKLEWALYRAYVENKERKSARAQLGRLVKNKPGETKYAYLLVEIEVGNKNYQSAIKILEHPALKKKLDLEHTSILIRQYVNSKQLKKSSAYGKIVAEKMPKALPVELGVFLYENEKISEAKNILNLVIKHNSSPEAYYYRARIAHQQKDYKTAVTYYKKGKNHSKEYNKFLAQCYLKQKNYRGAADAYEDYYDDVKERKILLILYGIYQKQVKDAKKRRDVLEKLVDAYPEKFNYVMDLADAYIETGINKKSLKIFARIIEKYPKNSKANLYMGIALADDKKYKAAIKRLSLGLKKNPGNVEGWKALGKAYDAIDNKRSAQFAYQKAELAEARAKKSAKK